MKQNPNDDGAVQGNRAPFEDMIGPAEAAKFLGVAVGTIHAWTHYRKIPCYKFSAKCCKYRRSELEAWAQAHAVGMREVGP